jgi:hypothetical protein
LLHIDIIHWEVYNTKSYAGRYIIYSITDVILRGMYIILRVRGSSRGSVCTNPQKHTHTHARTHTHTPDAERHGVSLGNVGGFKGLYITYKSEREST